MQAIRNVDIAMGNPEKVPTKPEMEVRTAARRSIVLNTDAAAGEKIHEDMLSLMRPGDGIQPADIDKVVGCSLKHDKESGDTLHWEDLSE